jgi:hypothetical protein
VKATGPTIPAAARTRHQAAGAVPASPREDPSSPATVSP